MKGDYEEFHALRWRKNKPNSKPKNWIPACAGMTVGCPNTPKGVGMKKKRQGR